VLLNVNQKTGNMRVFVTGASGFIGSAIVQELLKAGHQVLGLARSEESAKAIVAAGGEAHMGTLEDLDSLRKGIALADGVIQTAFIHDFSKFAANAEIDRLAVEAMLGALEGSGKPFVLTSGLLGLKPGHISTEKDMTSAERSLRGAAEVLTLAAASRGVRTSIIRLPPSVHGAGDHGFVPALIGIARKNGVAAYVGDGQNRWPAVHRFDAAHLYRLALEKGIAGSVYHGIGDEGVAVKDIAEVIGKHLNIPVVSKSPEEAVTHFEFLGHFIGMDSPATGKQTKEQLGWEPVQPGLIEDLDHARYF
jgi:nucleoside-diphosphate-sugar epimerase